MSPNLSKEKLCFTLCSLFLLADKRNQVFGIRLVNRPFCRVDHQCLVFLSGEINIWMLDLVPIRVDPAEIVRPALDAPLVGRVGQGGEGIVDIGQTDERR